MIDTGANAGDFLGYDVALSGDGKTMAVSSARADHEGKTKVGTVRLYSKDGTDWNVFQQINGTAANDYFGYSLDLSGDGSTLVVGVFKRAVYIYEFNNDTSVYDLFHSKYDIDAQEVCVSGDGRTIGVTPESTSIGARIFVKEGDGIQQRGLTFSGYGSAYSGISLSYNGTIVAIGDHDWSSRRGRLGMFQWKHDNGNGSMMWVRMGSDIEGDHGISRLGRYNTVSSTSIVNLEVPPIDI